MAGTGPTKIGINLEVVGAVVLAALLAWVGWTVHLAALDQRESKVRTELLHDTIVALGARLERLEKRLDARFDAIEQRLDRLERASNGDVTGGSSAPHD